MDAAEDRLWWYRAMHERVLEALRRRHPAGGRSLLDAGCGTGGLLRRLRRSEFASALVGIDVRPTAAGRAQAKSGADTVAGDLNALPFADGTFGAAVSADVLSHCLVDPARALAELRRVLAPGGTLVVNLPALEWLRSTHDARVHTCRRFTAAQVASLLRATGFQHVEARYWNALLLPIMAVRRKVLARRADAASDVASLPRIVNGVLHGVTWLEGRLSAGGVRYPAGGSVLAVASRA